MFSNKSLVGRVTKTLTASVLLLLIWIPTSNSAGGYSVTDAQCSPSSYCTYPQDGLKVAKGTPTSINFLVSTGSGFTTADYNEYSIGIASKPSGSSLAVAAPSTGSASLATVKIATGSASTETGWSISIASTTIIRDSISAGAEKLTNSHRMTVTINPDVVGDYAINLTATPFVAGTAGTALNQTFYISARDSLTLLGNDFTLVRDAVSSGSAVALTPAENAKAGAVFSKRRIDVSASFEVNVQLNFGSNASNPSSAIDLVGADGIAFVLQPNASTQVSSGGGIGYSGMEKAFAVEFDTYDNGGEESTKKDHVALMVGSSTNHGAWVPVGSSLITVGSAGNIEDGDWYTVQFQWEPKVTAGSACGDASKGKFTLRFDQNKNGSFDVGETLYNGYCLDLESYFAATGGVVYYGFTAATGGQNNLHQVRDLTSLVVTRSNEPPTIASIGNRQHLPGAGLQSLTTAINDDSTTSIQWTIEVTSSNTSVVTVGSYGTPPSVSGTAGSLLIRYTPSTSVTGTSTITVTITDGDDQTASTSFVVTVANDSGTLAPPRLTIAFNPNGADTTGYWQSEILGETKKLMKNTLTRSGYTFAGWNTKIDGSGTTFADEVLYKFDAGAASILYAQWTVVKLTPTVTWVNPSPIGTANALSTKELNAVGSVPGSCTYAPPLGSLLRPGLHDLTCVFTPSNTNLYTTVTKQVQIEVLADPTITWNKPNPIIRGTALSAAQLNALGSVPGTLTYTPSLGTVLKSGTHTLRVTLKPTDTRLPSVSSQVSIDVIPALKPSAEPITTISGDSGSSILSSLTEEAVVTVKSSGPGIERVRVTKSGLTVLSSSDFSGRTNVLLNINDEERSVELDVPVTVIPRKTRGTHTIASLDSSKIDWIEIKGAIGYSVSIDGKKVCDVSSGATLSCVAAVPTGPNSLVEIVTLGNAATRSERGQSQFVVPSSPVTGVVVNFRTASSKLSSRDREKLREFATLVQSLGLKEIEVRGHTDSVGGINNQRLSQQRANSTRRYVQGLLPEIKVEIQGFSFRDPLADNSSNSGKATNRRAEVFILG